MFEKILKDVSARVKDTLPTAPEDYEQDGLLYCGKCRSPKQTRIEVAGKVMTVYCVCRCRKEELEREEQARRQRAFDDRVRRLRAEAFDSPYLRACTFDADDCPDAFVSRVCRNFADRFEDMGHKGLLLFGGVGTGKSFYAACIANALVSRGIACRMTTMTALAKEREVPDNVRVVILDDFGTERDTEYMREAVWDVIDTLYRRQITLICTTNLTAKELKTAEDTQKQRIFSRLYEMCMFYELTGKDRRRERMKTDNAPYKAILEDLSVSA